MAKQRIRQCIENGNGSISENGGGVSGEAISVARNGENKHRERNKLAASAAGESQWG
jgi:hypothetical protein